MTEKKYDSNFHRWYLGESGGEIEPSETYEIPSPIRVVKTTINDILRDYRWYMRDKSAELPQEWVDEMLKLGMTWD